MIAGLDIGEWFLLGVIHVLAKVLIELQEVPVLKGLVFHELVELRSQHGSAPIVAIAQSQPVPLGCSLGVWVRLGACKTHHPAWTMVHLSKEVQKRDTGSCFVRV